MKKEIIITGIRGIPASHGGFETFAEYFALHMKSQGWGVTVYCQDDGKGNVYENEWKGIKLIHIPVSNPGPLGTIIFDWKSILHSLKQNGLIITLGYNTAIFNVLYRITGRKNIINMDGIEWKRQKWGKVAKTWFWLNERFGCWFGNHLVADHPEILKHLATRVSDRKITMIPYGAPEVNEADLGVLAKYDLKQDEYGIVIARAEPENSILEIVKGFSSRNRGKKLVVLGNYDSESNCYHRQVIDSASDEVVFLGAIYDKEELNALRKFSRFYIHGHQVGGTNPSLVEAIGAKNAILAHDNKFNRWVAKEAALYFSNEIDISSLIDTLFLDDVIINRLRKASDRNFYENFTWPLILQQYESLCVSWIESESANYD